MSKCTYTINGTDYTSYRKALEEAIQSAYDKNQPIILFSKSKPLTITGLKNIIKNNNEKIKKTGKNTEKSIGVTTLISGEYEQPKDSIQNLIRTYTLQAGIEKHKYIQGLIQSNKILQNEAIEGLKKIQESIRGFESWLTNIQSKEDNFIYNIDEKHSITIEREQFLKEDKSIDTDEVGIVINKINK